MGDGEYRRLKLGSEELDWQALEAHFNRSQNALRKKYWMLSKAPIPGTTEATPKQRAERKNWTEEETAELKRLVAVQAVPDNDGVDWDKLAAHFGTSVQTVKRKHRHAAEHAALATGAPVSAEKGATVRVGGTQPLAGRWLRSRPSSCSDSAVVLLVAAHPYPRQFSPLQASGNTTARTCRTGG